MEAASATGQVRQAGADDDQGGALLADLVAGAAQRRELGARDVLHLVDEQGDADPEVAGQLGDVGEQLDQVELEVPESARPLAASTSIGGCQRRRSPCGP